MMQRQRLLVLSTVLAAVGALVAGNITALAARPDRVLPEGKRPADKRLGTPRSLRDAYHPWVPPKTRKAWEQQAGRVRQQLAVAIGLWPMLPSIPLKPVIHGRIERDDYTIEKVYFASLPGHYVTGSLYRPKGKQGRRPGVLSPHGHWANGRFYDAGAKKAADQLKKGAEKFQAGARYPLQARMVQLARMGCVVFHYDMVGYADSGPVPHRTGFGDVAAVLRLQNLMGLQTFNSRRAIDFLQSLPDVDPKRIGITGASGGGTQSFMICGLDPRIQVAFPAVMISTGMQGGCVCENSCYLRQGINNITIAALFAPKPMALSGANDWTIDIETKGLPELKQIYGLYGKADRVNARCYPQFGHNYNQVSREMMYGWMNRYLDLKQKEPIQERDFVPVTPKELSVFDAEHPRPKDARTLEQFREYLSQVSAEQFADLLPGDKKGLRRYREVIGTAARVMLRPVPSGGFTAKIVGTGKLENGVTFENGTLGRTDRGEVIPWTLLNPRKPSGTLVAWFDGGGKAALFDDVGQPLPAVSRLLAAGHQVLSADVFLTGELVPEGKPVTSVATHGRFLGYTYGYNRPPLSYRVQDVLSVVTAQAIRLDAKRVHMVGTAGAGTWVLLARATGSGGRVARGLTLVDIGGFGFSGITRRDDPMLLPGALKYGGLGGLAALAAPTPLLVAGTRGVSKAELAPLATVYKVAGGRLRVQAETLTHHQVVELLLSGN